MQERDDRDPTPLEIAEECLRIHEEANREPPIGLMEKLTRLRR
jgi:hypothetical protein